MDNTLHNYHSHLYIVTLELFEKKQTDNSDRQRSIVLASDKCERERGAKFISCVGTESKERRQTRSSQRACIRRRVIADIICLRGDKIICDQRGEEPRENINVCADYDEYSRS